MSLRVARIARSLAAALALLLLAAPSAAGASPERHPAGVSTHLASSDTVYQGSCPQPRPPVKLAVQPHGDGQISVTVTAGFGTLFVILFGAMQNAHVVIPGSNQVVTSNSEIPVPPGLTSWTFIIVSDSVVPAGTPPPAVTIPLTVFDGCGLNHPWRTFAGGGFTTLVSTIEIGDAQIVETNAGIPIVTLPVRLSMPSRNPVTVSYATSNGSATASADFVAASGVITFAPGETQKAIPVQTIGDFDAEADETLTVTLSNPTNAVLRRSVATVKIVNDDTAPSVNGDFYVATAGQTLSVAAGAGLLANDQPGTQVPQIVSFGGLDAGGDVTTFPAGFTATLPGGVSLLVRADGSFTFTSAPAFGGSFSFRYRARSLSGQSDATVIISVIAGPVANDDPGYVVTPPSVLNVAAPGLMGNDLPGTPPSSIVQFGGFDAGGVLGTSTATPAGAVRNLGNGGSLQVNADGSFAFTAPSNVGGPFSFQYRLQNSVGFADASVTITVRRNPVIITTTGASGFAEGGGPVAVDPGLTITQPGGSYLTSATVTITNPPDVGQEALAANVGATGISASFVGNTLTLSNSSSLANYQQVLRSVTYVNGAGAPTAGNRSITFQVSDGTLISNTASKAVSVGAVNDAPSGANKTVTTVEDTAYTFAVADFGFTDPNDAPANQLQAVKIASLPTAGSLTNNNLAVTLGQFVPVADINAGRLKFAPAANGNGSPYASFTFQVQDNGGTANGGVDLDQSPNTITIDVTSVNDAPAGTNKTVTATEDMVYTFAVADFGFTDPNDSPANQLLEVEIVTLPAPGSMTLNTVAVTAGQAIPVADIAGGRLQFTPVANANGASYASFTFQVRDNGGTANGGVDLDPTPNTITINVTSINDAPAGSDKTVGTVEDVAYTFTAADFGFTDPDDAPPNLFAAVKIASLPAAGSLTNNNAAVAIGQAIPVADITGGLLRFTPAAGASGNPYASFTFRVQDDGGTSGGGVDLDQSPNTITVNVAPVSNAPVVITTSGTSTFIAKGGEVVVDGGVTVTDRDSSTLAWATITITNVKNGSAEGLDVDLDGLAGITKSRSRVDGAFTLTLTGPAPLATFQTALQRVTYDNNAHDLNLDNRIILFQVSDGTNTSNQAFKTVQLQDNT